MNIYQVGILAVRERAPNVYKLVYQLKSQGIEATVFWDDDRKGPAWNSRRAWGSFNTDYGVLLQDDIIISKTFKENLDGVIEGGRIDTVCAGFIGAPIVKKAHDKGARWIVGGNNVWGQCLIASMDWIREFIKWELQYMNPLKKTQDRRITMYLAWSKQSSYVTVPTLVDHMELKSAMGHPTRPFGKLRTSPVFIGDNVYDWERTDDNSYKWNHGSISGFGAMWAEGKP